MGPRPDAEDLVDATLADAGDSAEVDDHFAKAVEVRGQPMDPYPCSPSRKTYRVVSEFTPSVSRSCLKTLLTFLVTES